MPAWSDGSPDIRVPAQPAVTAAYRSWSGPARSMALGVDAAVSAARAGDAEAFADALTELARVDREQLAVLLGTMTQDLLERSHPDGLDSDDAEEALRRCIRSAAPWYEPLDSDVLIRALTGALGVADPDDALPVDASAVTAHGVLLIAELLAAPEDLAGLIDAALRELMRAQTVEMP